MGLLMNGIYFLLDVVGIPNIGLAIIFFTIIANGALTPLQIKQQKFGKMTGFMQPELQRIQDKYKNKKDQNSQMKMQEETMAVYQKFGVSPTGQCLPMILQMVIMFSLYQVIYHIPGYIGRVKDIFDGAATAIMGISGHADIITNFVTDHSVRMMSRMADPMTQNNVIDFLYALKPTQWTELAKTANFASIGTVLKDAAASAEPINLFLGMNITESPWDLLKASWASKEYLMVFGALMIPLLAWFTQWFSYKLMPQTNQQSDPKKNGQPSQMESSMKMMNSFMPVMSAVMCMTFSIGIGIYWIIGAVVRVVQQIVINRHLTNMDVEQVIEANQEKINKKRAKAGLPPQKITQQARMNVRNIEEPKPVEISAEEKKAAVDKSTAYYRDNTEYREGSLASKANMVRQFDEKKKKKK